MPHLLLWGGAEPARRSELERNWPPACHPAPFTDLWLSGGERLLRQEPVDIVRSQQWPALGQFNLPTRGPRKLDGRPLPPVPRPLPETESQPHQDHQRRDEPADVRQVDGHGYDYQAQQQG